MANGTKTFFDSNRLRAGIVAYENGIRDKAEAAVRETVLEGEDSIRRTIVASTRPTGERRAARGDGIAGRVESGQMYVDVDSTVGWEGKNTLVAKWGWPFDFQDYYGIQDAGSRHLTGMGALGTSFALVADRLKARLSRIVRGS